MTNRREFNSVATLEAFGARVVVTQMGNLIADMADGRQVLYRDGRAQVRPSENAAASAKVPVAPLSTSFNVYDTRVTLSNGHTLDADMPDGCHVAYARGEVRVTEQMKLKYAVSKV